MSDTKNQLASFHEEVMHDADYTLAEAVAEAKRCLNCKVCLLYTSELPTKLEV